MNKVQVEINGKWQEAKEEPYYPSIITKLKCFFSFHEWIISKKYRGTLTCFVCGKRKVGLTHY